MQCISRREAATQIERSHLVSCHYKQLQGHGKQADTESYSPVLDKESNGLRKASTEGKQMGVEIKARFHWLHKLCQVDVCPAEKGTRVSITFKSKVASD